MNQPNQNDVLQKLATKFEDINQDIATHLEGMLWSKPITYWDYVQTDVLLNLQTQRTSLPDEMVFIIYHQINELIFKMTLWEIQQIANHSQLTGIFYQERIQRISRYFDMLTNSFDIMKDGMEVEQYNKFRHTLTPASGFQSAQYRFIEFASTDVINLIDVRFRKDFNVDISVENTINHLYWQAAGKDYQTGQKSYLLEQFEKRYHQDFVNYIKNYQHKNLWQKYLQLTPEEQQNTELLKTMRHFDYTVNITWVMGHYQAAKKYIESSYGNGQATGGSDWKKYMLPKYQKRIFFPKLWTEEERNQWGIKESEVVES